MYSSRTNISHPSHLMEALLLYATLVGFMGVFLTKVPSSRPAAKGGVKHVASADGVGRVGGCTHTRKQERPQDQALSGQNARDKSKGREGLKPISTRAPCKRRFRVGLSGEGNASGVPQQRKRGSRGNNWH
ncbi:hypothetical protein CPC08DRAFT_725076 [Agrocybe pediades]|nr:hypothetical protein CPC08DRAFT_725076 [Agrocybe pediades]